MKGANAHNRPLTEDFDARIGNLPLASPIVRTKGPGQDPALPHVAFGVSDIQETRAELDRRGAELWVAEGIVGPESQQIFVNDPAGNMIELHQVGKCRCQAVNR